MASAHLGDSRVFRKVNNEVLIKVKCTVCVTQQGTLKTYGSEGRAPVLLTSALEG